MREFVEEMLDFPPVDTFQAWNEYAFFRFLPSVCLFGWLIGLGTPMAVSCFLCDLLGITP